MSLAGGSWDLAFAIRVDEVSSRLQKQVGPAFSVVLGSRAGGIFGEGTLAQLSIVECRPGVPRVPGQRPTLTLHFVLSGVTLGGDQVMRHLSGGPGAAAPSNDERLQLGRVEGYADLGLQFVRSDTGGDQHALRFESLPPNAPGAHVLEVQGLVTGTTDAALNAMLRSVLQDWLRSDFGRFAPALAVIDKPSGAAPTSGWMKVTSLHYSYVQSHTAGQDILCVFAMLNDRIADPNGMRSLLPEIVEDGTVAVLLGEQALMGDAMVVALNAFASATDAASTAKANGNPFVFDPSTTTVKLGAAKDGSAIRLRNGTVENDRILSDVFITDLSLRLGEDVLVLSLSQFATLKTHRTYTNRVSIRTLEVEWCNISRTQCDELHPALTQGDPSTQAIKWTPNVSKHIDQQSATPYDESWTGNPQADYWINFAVHILTGTAESALCLLGPPGVALFLLKLAATTAERVAEIHEIAAAAADISAIAVADILKPTAFQWAGLGAVQYSTVRIDGGLKFVGRPAST